MIRPFLAIAAVTFAEVTRQPACGLVILTSVAIVGVAPLLAMFGFGQDLGLLKELTLSNLYLAGAVLASLGASSVLGKDLERGTTLTLLSKPVGPGTFLAGRFAGLAATVILFVYLSVIAILLATRQGPADVAWRPLDWPVLAGGLGGGLLALPLGLVHSVRASRPFLRCALLWACVTLTAGFLLAGCFDPGWRPRSFLVGYNAFIAQAALLVAFGLLAFAAVAVLLSVILRRGAFPVAVLAFLFFLGFGGRGVLLSFLPALEVFWVGDLCYRSGATIPSGYLAASALYAGVCSSVCLLIGAWVLRRRDLG